MAMRLFKALFISLGAMALTPPVMASPEDFHQTTDENQTQIDNTAWNSILSTYLSRTEDNTTQFDYEAVTNADKASLKAYIEALSSIDPTTLNRNEAFAYWANLYNAVTIDVVLDHYPVKSILRITSGLRPGPWKKKLVTVNGEKLSLDNIEHDILRAYFKDPRVHYAVNCASIGCPNLGEKALTGAALDDMLNAGARDYINHPRGVSFDGNRVTVSTIYKWFREDFGDSEEGVIRHLIQYAEPGLKEQLEGATKINKYEYDWKLNQTR